MDVTSLDKLLADTRTRQFWLKPIGFPKDHPDWDVFETRKWTESEIEIHLAKTPAKIAVGAIIIAYRIHVSKLIFVAERLPMEAWSAAESRSDYSRRRWPFYIKGSNFTPEYGAVWNQYSLQPFALAKDYKELHPEDPVRLGSIQRGNDKALISRGFAEFLIRQIRDVTTPSLGKLTASPSRTLEGNLTVPRD